MKRYPFVARLQQAERKLQALPLTTIQRIGTPFRGAMGTVEREGEENGNPTPTIQWPISTDGGTPVRTSSDKPASS